MKLKDISFERINDLIRIMKMPREFINFVSPKEMVSIMKHSKQKITVHLYPVGWRYKSKSLLDMHKWSYHQIYLTIKNDLLYCCIGHGDTSGGRQWHNELIDLFLKDKKLIKETPTAVLIAHKNILLAYYFYESYAYSNHDIGWNWDRAIRDRLKKSRLPYSYMSNLDKKEVWFKGKKEEILVYKTLNEDIYGRNLHKKLREMMSKQAKLTE